MKWNWRQRQMRLLLGVAVVACALRACRAVMCARGGASGCGGAWCWGSGRRPCRRGHHVQHAPGHRHLSPRTAQPRRALLGIGHVRGRVPAVGSGTHSSRDDCDREWLRNAAALSAASVSKGDSLAEETRSGRLPQAVMAPRRCAPASSAWRWDPVDRWRVSRFPSRRQLRRRARGGSCGSGGSGAWRRRRCCAGRVGAPAGAGERGVGGSTAPTRRRLRAAVPGRSVAPGVRWRGSLAVGEVATAPTPAVAGSRSIAAAPQATRPPPRRTPRWPRSRSRFAHFVLSAMKGGLACAVCPAPGRGCQAVVAQSRGKVRVRFVSGPWMTMLRQQWAGDTLHRLISCPGPFAFMCPGAV
jgi:hypothetical protein